MINEFTNEEWERLIQGLQEVINEQREQTQTGQQREVREQLRQDLREEE